VLWTPGELEVYCYQTNVLTTSGTSITDAYVTIYDGPPGAPTSNVIFGDFTTNRIQSVTFRPGTAAGTFTYRTTQTTLTNNTRPLQAVKINLAGCPVLGNATASKQYWIGVSLAGTSASGPFVPPIAPARATDNAVGTGDFNATAAWPAIIDATSVLPNDFPFILRGTAAGTSCPAPASTTLVLPANGSFVTNTQTLAAAETKFYKITLATAITSGATGGSRLDIDTEGTLLTGETGGAAPNDTLIVLYSENGSIVSSDDDSGSGFLSQLSFGQGIGFSTTTAFNFDGRNGGTLAAGNYYLGVTALGTAFTALPGFTLTSDSTATGPLTVRARRVNSVPAISPAILGTIQPFPALVSGDGFQTANVPVVANTTKWVSLVVPAAIDATKALDIMTEGSTLTPANDCSLGLYDSTGALIATDFVNGSGSLALISLGGGFRPRVNTSWNFYGQNGAALAAGTYYLAVVGGDTNTFNGSNFNVQNGAAANAGNVLLSVRYRSDVSADIATVPTIPAAQDFGILADGSASRTVTVPNESVTFFKFEIPAGAPLNASLLIDTEGSTLAPLNDTAIRLFSADGSIPASNGGIETDNGSGFLSQLSFGDGTYILNTPALAQRGNSRTSTFPGEGVYYLGVRSGNAGGSAAGWNLSANGLNGGELKVNIRYLADPSIVGTEAPTPSLAPAVIGGEQAFTTDLAPFDIVWVKFTYPDTATFSDFIDIDTADSGAIDSYIGIYDNLGNLIAINDDSGTGLNSLLSFGTGAPARPAAGTTAIPAGQNGDLTPGQTYWVGATMWGAATIAFNASNWDTRVVQNLLTPGYTITLRSSFPAVVTCLADINGDGTVDGSDYTDFINSFGVGDAGLDPRADVNHDGIVDGSDYTDFINAFGAGC
jgi:hypothetical protein